MLKNYFFITLVALLGGASPAAHAQASFQPGYLVRPAGDTVRGEVQLLGELRNAQAARFRPAAAATATDYAPTQARAYGVPGQAAFVARLVPAADSGGASQPLFVQQLVGGPASLYSCRDRPGRTRYFVAVQGGRLRELVERRVKTFANSFEAYQIRALYRDTLAAALTGCVVARTQLPTLPFTQTALVRLVAAYNECASGPSAVRVVAASEPPARGIGVLAGYQNGELAFSASAFTSVFLATAPPLWANSFTAGGELIQELPHTRHALSMRLGVLYAYERYEGGATNRASTTALPAASFNAYQVTANYLHVPLLVRYTWRRHSRLQPLLEGGLLYSRALTVRSSFSQLNYFNQPGDFVYDNFGYALGVGLRGQLPSGRWLGGHLRYQTANGLSNYIDIGASVSYFCVLLSLSLGKL